MKTKFVRTTAFVMFMMSVGAVTAQARMEREFLLMQEIKERKAQEVAIRQAEVSRPYNSERVETSTPASTPNSQK